MKKKPLTRQPNTFIIGAPKCGTTSLATWLGEHPNAFVSTPKEPYFFCRSSLQLEGINELREYEMLFHPANNHHIVVAEGSTGYIYDVEALPNLLDYQPEASIVVMLRNPIEMAPSWHAECVREFREDILDFTKAWDAIMSRRQGKSFPRQCPDPLLLDYENICALGTQLQCVYNLVQQHRVHTILLDDIQTDPRSVWLHLLEFLNLDDDGRRVFPAQRVGYMPKNYRVYTTLIFYSGYLKRVLGLQFSTGLVEKLLRIRSRGHRPAHALSSSVREKLADAFEPEISLLEQITGRDLSGWRSKF